jgi:hypothetical protein
VEGREWHAACDDGLEMIVPLGQLSKNIEDEAVVRDHTVDATEGVGHALHLAIVVAHQEVALDEVRDVVSR